MVCPCCRGPLEVVTLIELTSKGTAQSYAFHCARCEYTEPCREECQ